VVVGNGLWSMLGGALKNIMRDNLWTSIEIRLGSYIPGPLKKERLPAIAATRRISVDGCLVKTSASIYSGA